MKSKWLTLIVVIGPLLVIFLTGIAFDNLNEYRINIRVYSSNYNELTTSFISKLNTEQFRTIKSNSEAECIDDVKIGMSHTCVIFPPNLSLGGKNKDILIFIDYSKLNLAWIIRDRLFSRVEQRSTEITKQLTDNILSKLLLTRKEISSDMVVITVVRFNEDSVINKTAEALYFVASINTTVGLNSSDIDRLKSKIDSIKTASDIAIEESKLALDFSEELVNEADFTSSEEDNFYSIISKERSVIEGQQNYIESLFSPEYSGSINKTIGDIRYRVNRINRNSNATEQFVSKSKTNLYDANQLTATNIKLLNKVYYSMDNVKKELDNVDELSAEDIAMPVVADIKPLTSYNSYLNYMFPTLMALAVMLSALYLASIVVVMELNTQAFFRNMTSPTTNVYFFFASYLTNLSLVGIQIFIMLVISMFFFFTQVISNILTTLAICFLIASFFVVLGMGIGYIFKTEQMSTLATTFSASIFIFLSNLLMPIENMPHIFTKIVEFNPFIISVSLLRKSILFQQSLIAVNEEILFLVIFTLVLLMLYAAFYYLTAKKQFRMDNT